MKTPKKTFISTLLILFFLLPGCATAMGKQQRAIMYDSPADEWERFAVFWPIELPVILLFTILPQPLNLVLTVYHNLEGLMTYPFVEHPEDGKPAFAWYVAPSCYYIGFLTNKGFGSYDLAEKTIVYRNKEAEKKQQLDLIEAEEKMRKKGLYESMDLQGHATRYEWNENKNRWTALEKDYDLELQKKGSYVYEEWSPWKYEWKIFNRRWNSTEQKWETIKEVANLSSYDST